MYKDKEKQRQANKAWAAKNRAKADNIKIDSAQDGSGSIKDVVPIAVVPSKDTTNVVPARSTHDPVRSYYIDDMPKTIEEMIVMTDTDAKAILKNWAMGNGSQKQQRLGMLSMLYDTIKHGMPLAQLRACQDAQYINPAYKQSKAQA